MRADVGAVVALDALGLVPGGNGDGDAALLVSGSAQLPLAVHVRHEGGNRQAVAVHAVDGVENVLDLLDQLRLALEHFGLVLVHGVGPVGGNVDLLVGGGAEVDGLVVHIDDVLTLLQVGVRRGVLHVLDGLLLGHDLGEGEERGLKDGVVALAHADLDGEVDGVDGVELDVIPGDVALGVRLEVMVQLIEIPLAVDHEHAAGLDVVDHLEALDDVAGVVAGDEVGLVDVVGALDGLVAEAQVADGHAAGLLGVILEVGLNVLVGMVADDLDGVLVRADGTVAAETPELALDGAFRRGVRAVLVLGEGEASHVIDDADGELTLHLVLLQLAVNGEDGSGRGILGAETVTAADDLNVGLAGVGERGDDVEVQGLTLCAGLLGAVEDGDLLAGRGNGLEQALGLERTVQADLDETDLFAVGVEVVDDLLGHVADGAHRDDDAVGVGRAVVVEQLIVGAELGVDLIHVGLNDLGQRVIILVAGFTMLEEGIAVLVGAAHMGMLGIEGVLTEGLDGVHVAHLGEVLIIPDRDLLDLVAGAEAVEEVDEGDLAGQRREMGDGAEVHDLLHVALAEHGKAGLAAGHHVGMVTEDVQRVGGNGTRGNMEHAGELLGSDLVHIGDHQQQALRRRVGGRQSAGAEGAVHRAGRAGLGLHLDDLHAGAEDVLQSVGAPLVNKVGHGARGGDGVNRGNFAERIGYMRGSVITVHGLHFSCHK